MTRYTVQFKGTKVTINAKNLISAFLLARENCRNTFSEEYVQKINFKKVRIFDPEHNQVLKTY